MAESFCAEHNYRLEEVLYEWPASKFQAIYGAFVKRKVADDLSRRKDMEVSALWGNPNLDNEKEPEGRQKLMKELENSYNKAISSLYSDSDVEEEDLDEEDPFFKAMNKGLQKRGLPVPTNDMDS